jgi:NAD-dependent deacetylase
VVWLGLWPLVPVGIYTAVAGCFLFAGIGTWGLVYPGAGFALEIPRHGRAHSIELNLEPSAVNSLFAKSRHGPAGEIVPRWVEEVLGQEVADALPDLR